MHIDTWSPPHPKEPQSKRKKVRTGARGHPIAAGKLGNKGHMDEAERGGAWMETRTGKELLSCLLKGGRSVELKKP